MIFKTSGRGERVRAGIKINGGESNAGVALDDSSVCDIGAGAHWTEKKQHCPDGNRAMSGCGGGNYMRLSALR